MRWAHRPAGSNWGEFGPDDQIGRMNLINNATRLAAMAEVRTGQTFCLSLPLDFPGESVLSENRAPPVIEGAARPDGRSSFNLGLDELIPGSTDVTNDERVTLHSQYSTQWDALRHFGQRFDADGDGIAEQVFYNGFRASDGEVQEGGLDIAQLAIAGVQGRGVLVDLVPFYGRERIRVGLEGLNRAMAEAHVEVRPGDFLCIRTGFAERLLEMGKHPDPAILDEGPTLNGRDPALHSWIAESGIVAICADNPAVERLSRPQAGQPSTWLPLHELCLFRLGIHLGELWWFDELAAWLREHDRSSFLLTAPPLRLPGAAGSPVTPIATV
jgi:kynurenine formamidase